MSAPDAAQRLPHGLCNKIAKTTPCKVRMHNYKLHRVGKTTGSRECAPDDKLRVPTMPTAMIVVGTAQMRLCPPYKVSEGALYI